MQGNKRPKKKKSMSVSTGKGNACTVNTPGMQDQGKKKITARCRKET